MNLEIDITINNTGNTLWVEDKSPWESEAIGEKYNYYVTNVTILFINYIDSSGTITDLNTTISVPSPTGKFTEINAFEINNSWTTFPEGIYNIQFGVTVNSGNNIIEPTNNGSYYYQQVIFWDIAQYIADLLYSVAQSYNGYIDPDTKEISNALKDDYLYRYIIQYGTKFEGLQAAINVSGSLTQVEPESVPEVLNSLLVLQKMKEQYPNGNYTRRFRK